MTRTPTKTTEITRMTNQHNKTDAVNKTGLSQINNHSNPNLRIMGITKTSPKITAKAKAVIFTAKSDLRKIQVGARLFPFRKHWQGAAHEGIVKIGLSWSWKKPHPALKRLRQKQ